MGLLVLFSLLRLLFSGPKRNYRRNTTRVSTKTVVKEVTKVTPQGTVTSQESVKVQTISGTCWVIDGDTIAIGEQKIRLAGINAPEMWKWS